MTQLPNEPATDLAIRKGRRGMFNTILCCVLALPCAFAVWFVTERSTIAPACTAYATANGMTYTDFKLVGVKHASTVVCLLTQGNGKIKDVHLSELVPFFTDMWVGFAMTLEITIPAFAILLALAMVEWHRRTIRVSA